MRSFHPQKIYDVIISNPPFYENEFASETKNKNVAHHSEQLTVAEVVQFIKNYLKEGGLFFLLFPFKRKNELQKLFRQNELYLLESVILSQSVKHSPFRVMLKGSNKKSPSEKSNALSIWVENQQYTQPFIELLKDYYLYL
jgi:tRNA1Val (adenine37-N6)-methyltransferase